MWGGTLETAVLSGAADPQNRAGAQGTGRKRHVPRRERAGVVGTSRLGSGVFPVVGGTGTEGHHPWPGGPRSWTHGKGPEDGTREPLGRKTYFAVTSS